MRKEVKLLLKILIPLVIVELLIGFIWYNFIRKDPYELNGTQMFTASMDYFYSAQDIADQMDTTVSLYLNENIDEEAYILQMTAIRQQMNYLLKDYHEFKETYHVEIGSYSYTTKAGTEAVDQIINMLSNLIGNCLTESGDKTRLSYIYLAFIDDMIEPMAIVNKSYAEVYQEP